MQAKISASQYRQTGLPGGEWVRFDIERTVEGDTEAQFDANMVSAIDGVKKYLQHAFVGVDAPPEYEQAPPPAAPAEPSGEWDGVVQIRKIVMGATSDGQRRIARLFREGDNHKFLNVFEKDFGKLSDTGVPVYEVEVGGEIRCNISVAWRQSGQYKDFVCVVP
jgi:hypothetical protein